MPGRYGENASPIRRLPARPISSGQPWFAGCVKCRSDRAATSHFQQVLGKCRCDHEDHGETPTTEARLPVQRPVAS